MVEQISVFLENKHGRLAEVTETLSANKINIRALSIADTTDFGILRLIVDQPQRAYSILKEANFVVSITEVIAVSMPDESGALARVLAALAKEKINIEYLYAFVTHDEHKALVIFRVEEITKAIEVLGREGFEVVDSKKLYSL
jgi:hypothetical protein